MIGARGLELRLGGRPILAGIDLEVDAGEGVLVAGANGCGRTTLLEVLATLRAPAAGSLDIDGVDALRRPLAARRRIGHLAQRSRPPLELTAFETLDLLAAARGLDRGRRVAAIAGALELSGLEAATPVERLSHGGRRALELAAALLGEPPVLLLDQPFAALDPLARSGFARELAARRHAGAALVVVENSLADLGGVCGRAVILEGGRMTSGFPLDAPPAGDGLAERLRAARAAAAKGAEDGR